MAPARSPSPLALHDSSLAWNHAHAQPWSVQALPCLRPGHGDLLHSAALCCTTTMSVPNGFVSVHLLSRGYTATARATPLLRLSSQRGCVLPQYENRRRRADQISSVLATAHDKDTCAHNWLSSSAICNTGAAVQSVTVPRARELPEHAQVNWLCPSELAMPKCCSK
jgi:hypothetical protein